MISGSLNLHPMMATVPLQVATAALLDDRPYAIKALYLQGTNPLVSYPDSQAVREALERVAFLAVAEVFQTPTAAMADIVLPAATGFEFNDIGHYGLPHGFLLARPKLVDPPGFAWSDMRILNELGKKLGLAEFFWDDEAEMLDHLLSPSGLGYQAFVDRGVLRGKASFRSYRDKGFKTPSGKVELFSSVLEKMGLDPLPSFVDPIDATNHLSPEYPFVLTSAKNPVFFHSTNRQIDSLRRISPDPVVEISSETAHELGICDADWVWIRTSGGKIRQRARVNPRMDPRVVCAEYGWWFPEQDEQGLFGWNRSNLNVLTTNTPPYDPLVASVNLRCIPCALERAE
jgi:anaerobic selenocysteine-containing dehydrogenase